MTLVQLDAILLILALVCFLIAGLARNWRYPVQIGWIGLALWVLVPTIDAVKAF